ADLAEPLGENVAVKNRVAVRPDDHASGVAAVERVGAQHNAAPHLGALRVAHVGVVLALEAAADGDLAAAATAVDIHRCDTGCHDHLFTADVDASADAAAAAGADRSGHVGVGAAVDVDQS